MAKKKEKKSIADLVEIVSNRNGVVVSLGRNLVSSFDTFSGNPVIDAVIFAGRGIPSGTIVQITGWEASGKSMLTKSWLASMQKQFPEKAVAVVASEYGDYTPEALEETGIDPDRLIVISRGIAEEELSALQDLLFDRETLEPHNILSVWAIDSLPALLTSAEIEKDLDEDSKRAAHASLMHKFLRRISIYHGDAIGLIVNQLRTSQDATGRPGTHNFGGKALPFWGKASLKLTKYEPEESAARSGKSWHEKVTGAFSISVHAEKNNLRGHGHEGVKASYVVNLEKKDGMSLGVDHVQCLVRVGVITGVINKGAGWHKITINGEELNINGEISVIKTIKEKGYENILEEMVMKAAAEKFSLGIKPEIQIDPITGDIIEDEQ